MQIRDKEFKVFIPFKDIEKRVKELAFTINEDYDQLKPLFLAILNGSFMFASDLIREIHTPCEISFIKLSSYETFSSTGNVNELIGLKEDIKGRHLIILEDIVDTGNTISHIQPLLEQEEIASLSVATLLFKPSAIKKEVDIKYIGFSIPETFVVGYGLDYDGLGRNLKDLYQLIEKEKDF